MAYSNHKGLTQRAIAAFEKAWPRLVERGGGKVSLPIDPDDPKAGTLAMLFRDRLSVKGKSTAQARGKAYGNQAIDIHFTRHAGQGSVRRRVAHEVTHTSQRVLGLLGTAHDDDLYERQARWEARGGAEMGIRDFYRRVAHGDLPIEHEAETVALLECLRVGDEDIAADALVNQGPYLRCDRGQFLDMATAHGVGPDGVARFDDLVARLAEGMRGLRMHRRHGPNASVALRMLAGPMRVAGIDPVAAMQDGLDGMRAFVERQVARVPKWRDGGARLVAEYAAEMDHFAAHGALPEFWLTALGTKERNFPVAVALGAPDPDAMFDEAESLVEAARAARRA